MKRKEALKTLKIAQGNLKATIEMVEEGRYCVDVSNQVLAVVSLLKKANRQLIEGHMYNCVMDVFDSEDVGLKQEKMSELVSLMTKADKL